jgi:subtilisin family serine protease
MPASTAKRTDRPTFGGVKPRRETVPGQYVCRIHPDAILPHLARPAGIRITPAAVRSLPPETVEPIEYLAKTAGLKSVEPLFGDSERPPARGGGGVRARMALAQSVASEDDELAGLVIATVEKHAAAKRVLSRIRSARTVDFIEPLPTRWLTARGADPMRNQQWGLRAINWFEAAKPSRVNLIVGVMDTGVDAGHPDLKGVQVDYEHAGTAARDFLGHGTHVSGIIAAIANNSVGIAGVARCKLAMWKIFDDTPDSDGEFYVNTTRYYRALRAAADKGIAVLNLSIGGTVRDSTEELLLRRLVRAGITVCAAMGNEFEEGNPIEYPGAFGNVVAVGAIGEDRRRTSFSNTGRHINISAPGLHILSTLPRQRSQWLDETSYAAWNGTSMATPHVSGAAVLVAAANSSFGPSEVAERLQTTAARLGAMRGRKFTQEYGAGLLDVRRALS